MQILPVKTLRSKRERFPWDKGNVLEGAKRLERETHQKRDGQEWEETNGFLGFDRVWDAWDNF